jgi:hypothetical protein
MSAFMIIYFEFPGRRASSARRSAVVPKSRSWQGVALSASVGGSVNRKSVAGSADHAVGCTVELKGASGSPTCVATSTTIASLLGDVCPVTRQPRIVPPAPATSR